MKKYEIVLEGEDGGITAGYANTIDECIKFAKENFKEMCKHDQENCVKNKSSYYFYEIDTDVIDEFGNYVLADDPDDFLFCKNIFLELKILELQTDVNYRVRTGDYCIVKIYTNKNYLDNYFLDVIKVELIDSRICFYDVNKQNPIILDFEDIDSIVF